jgi:uncharacterized protein YdeI (YjbR/CyaY-like superfamily)
MWSKRNVDHVARLIEAGRMRERGFAEIERAKADGRWDRAYDGPATIAVPAELQAALDATPQAAAAFQTLGSAARYSILHNVVTARDDVTRTARIARHIERLEIHQPFA